jgi:pyruvate dehydrogenase E2 component (dihydrolipoamide acetyltransferase)
MQFRLPDVGEGITESTLLRWHVKAGQPIQEDDPFCDIETDKAVVEITAPCTGKVLSIDVGEGATVAVGTVLAQLASNEVEAATMTVAAPSVAADRASEAATTPKQRADRPRAPRAAPSTRRYAHELGVDLFSVEGSGPGGRIVREDLSVASSSTRTPMTRLRQIIAENMRKSVSLIPHATSSFRCDAVAFIELRERCQERFGQRISYSAMLMKAMVPALKAYPHFNASIDEESREIVTHRDFNIGFAVHTDEGLMVPVLRDVQRKSLLEISQEIDKLAAAARERRIELASLRGATITLSNLGSHGGHEVTGRPIINHPQVALIAAGRIRPEPAVYEGAVCVRPTLNLTTSYDHRLIDGVYASLFMERFIEIIEAPGMLLALA